MDIENEIRDLESKIEELKNFSKTQDIDFSQQIKELEEKLDKKLEEYSKQGIDAWKKTKISRNPKRPYTLDYIEEICSDFVELHGDRLSRDDKSIVGGIGTIDDYDVFIIGHQKGRDIESNIYRNFGMANPEGYRKALRLMKMAERFSRPILTFIDTSGAYPGIEAEEKGQSEAIARNLTEMFDLKVPIVSVVIGEGGSGGALGLGVSDSILMLENSIYSVISPEGCASILFKDSKRAADAANFLKIDALSLKSLGIVDEIVKEPIGGAHRDVKQTAINLKNAVLKEFKKFNKIEIEKMLEKRYNKYRNIGQFIVEGEMK